MTPDVDRRLEVAQRVWQESQPSEDEVDRAVQRMQFKSARRVRRGRLRFGPALAVAVALIAVLAYAAPGSRAQITGAARRALGAFGYGSQPVEPPDTQRSGASAGAAQPGPASAVVSEKSTAAAPVDVVGSSEQPEAAAARPRDRVVVGSADARQRATWQDVNRALAAGNDQSAAKSLRELERGAVDRATRAKARLGLAQLAVGRGDCETARRLARSVATTPNLDEKIVQRAHTVMLRCEIR